VRKFPGYDDDLIAFWFHRMDQIAPGLMKPLESLFCNLTFPDLLPVASLFDTLMRYSRLERIKEFDASEVRKLPTNMIIRLADLTTENGETLAFDRGCIKPHFDLLDHLTDELDEQDRLYAPYTEAFNHYLLVAAFIGLELPAGKTVEREHRAPNAAPSIMTAPSAEYRPEPRKRPALRLVASNGKRLG